MTSTFQRLAMVSVKVQLVRCSIFRGCRRTFFNQPVRVVPSVTVDTTGRPTRWLSQIEIPAGAPVIVEGVYCLDEAVRDAYSFSVLCRAPYELRLSRGLDRDGEDAREQWVEVWMPLEEQYAQLQRPEDNVDLVLDSGTGLDGIAFTIAADHPA